MDKIVRLDIDAIKSCLLDTQKNFDHINTTLKVRRKPPSNEVINNLLMGYRKIDEHIANDIDLFAMGNSQLILELNHIVLQQSSSSFEDNSPAQFKTASEHFYQSQEGGIGQLMEWLSLNEGRNIWKKTAGIFTHLLSQPQLFIEGNHRTGSLIMSYLLMRSGHSPFVLSYENAKHFFEPAEITKSRHKKALLDEYLHLPKQTRKFAKLLQAEQSSRFLL